jgi:hypothetical protein
METDGNGRCVCGRAPALRYGSGCARSRARYNCAQLRRAPSAGKHDTACAPPLRRLGPAGAHPSRKRRPSTGPSPRDRPREESGCSQRRSVLLERVAQAREALAQEGWRLRRHPRTRRARRSERRPAGARCAAYARPWARTHARTAGSRPCRATGTAPGSTPGRAPAAPPAPPPRAGSSVFSVKAVRAHCRRISPGTLTAPDANHKRHSLSEEARCISAAAVAVDGVCHPRMRQS